MAVAGRFMTKWETVGGMGTRRGLGAGVPGLLLEGRFWGTEAYSPFSEALRTESPALWMKVRPSSQKGRTNLVTCVSVRDERMK